MMSPIDAYLRRDPPRTFMHWTRFAPELSATSRTVRIWIMALLLHELLDEADHDEPLVSGDRAMLLDFNLVADLELVLLVVRLEAGARPDVLAVQGIAARVRHLHGHGLVHLVADDLAGHLAAIAVSVLTGALVGRARRG